MGCGTSKEKIQTDILVLRLEKAEIEEERERLIHQLKLLTKKKEYDFSVNPSTNPKSNIKLSYLCGTEYTE